MKFLKGDHQFGGHCRFSSHRPRRQQRNGPKRLVPDEACVREAMNQPLFLRLLRDTGRLRRAHAIECATRRNVWRIRVVEGRIRKRLFLNEGNDLSMHELTKTGLRAMCRSREPLTEKIPAKGVPDVDPGVWSAPAVVRHDLSERE
ncbi:hypothetical protein [Microbaculum marinisediminis]|uniref:Uncharacterized protein n=1 Tax=Microbaculum marinisediminis TaxID=2931392 RepID=A0AAW5R2E1_9HYPH|nr:hypothetical protein [Microbaculum sp. A6E488]MCT8972710.1 hypothetical protein [Microbaculum sp. A6E488]